MTLQSRRKRQTIPLSLRRSKSIELAYWLSASVVLGLFSLSCFSSSHAADLQWGPSGRSGQTEYADTGNPLRATPSDSAVNSVAWEEDDALAAELDEPIADVPALPDADPFEAEEQITEKTLPTVDPFEAEDRVAQLVTDPFDEPLEGPIPPLDTETDLDEIEEALDREQQRREEEPETVEEKPEREDFEEPLSRDQEERTQIPERRRSDFTFELKTPERLPETRRSEQDQQEPRDTETLRENRKNCQEELASAKADRVSSVDLNINIEGIPGEDYPFECAFGNEPLEPRSWPGVTYNWKASALCHKPLYFEQDQLERYGHTWGPYLQPIMSGVHFFTSVPILPYKMGIEPPTECIYALGHYRPGSCAPYMIEPTPFTWRAAFFQAGFVTGTAFAIP